MPDQKVVIRWYNEIRWIPLSVLLSVRRIWEIHNSVVLTVWRNSVNPTILPDSYVSFLRTTLLHTDWNFPLFGPCRRSAEALQTIAGKP